MADYLHAIEIQSSSAIGLRPLTNIPVHKADNRHTYAALQLTHQSFRRKCGVVQ